MIGISRHSILIFPQKHSILQYFSASVMINLWDECAMVMMTMLMIYGKKKLREIPSQGSAFRVAWRKWYSMRKLRCVHGNDSNQQSHQATMTGPGELLDAGRFTEKIARPDNISVVRILRTVHIAVTFIETWYVDHRLRLKVVKTCRGKIYSWLWIFSRFFRNLVKLETLTFVFSIN